MNRLIAVTFVAIWASVAHVAPAASSIATYSKEDLARAFGAACGVGAKNKIRLHRNAHGNMLYMIAERQSEGVLYAAQQSCNKLQDDVLDLWRDDKGVVTAQLIDRGDGYRLLFGEQAELRGKRFDIERTGQYVIVSHGTTSTLSSVAKPYMKLADVTMDAQRLFIRKGALLVVGDNPATGRLEGRTIRITPTGLMEDPAPVSLADMPAGIRILDYSETNDQLLLAGMGASGQPSFVVVNVGSGSAAAVEPIKPGDDAALFIDDETVRERLIGTRTAAKGGSASPGNKTTKPTKKGWFGFGK